MYIQKFLPVFVVAILLICSNTSASEIENGDDSKCSEIPVRCDRGGEIDMYLCLNNKGECLKADLDKQLNKLIVLLEGNKKDPDSKNRIDLLRLSQTSWEGYKDNYCEFERYWYTGTTANLTIAGCRVKKYEERLKEIMSSVEWLESR